MSRAGHLHSMKPVVRLPKDPSACWEWLAYCHSQKGVAQKHVGGRNVPARRWMWENLFGVIPQGMVIAQKCGNPGCVNPHHLKQVSMATALREGLSAKLVAADAFDIRKAKTDYIEKHSAHPQRVRLSVLARQLSRNYEVSPETIRDIWRGDTWRSQSKHPTATTPSAVRA